mgnify:CR=1 FL=1
MSPDSFEQLVSAWLDDPQSEALARRVNDAVRADPALAALLAQWQASERLLRREPLALSRVDWTALRSRIGAAIDRQSAADDDARLDALLRNLPGIEERVDWTRLRERVAGAVGRVRKPRRGPRWYWTATIATSALAAAAALVLTILPVRPGGVPGVSASPVAWARVSAPAPAASVLGGTAVARVARSPLPAEPDTYLSIDPPLPGAAAASADYLD